MLPLATREVEDDRAALEAEALLDEVRLAQDVFVVEAIERSDVRPKECRVACLVSMPSLFNSEVTLFFDEDYFRTFLPREEGQRNYFEGGWVEDEPVEIEALGELSVAAPAGMEFFGGTLLRQYDPAWGRKPVEQVTWVWAFPGR